MTPKRFQHCLWRVMESQNLTQAAVARAAGLDPARVWDWYHGKSMPSLRAVWKVCEGLGISPNELLDWENAENQSTDR